MLKQSELVYRLRGTEPFSLHFLRCPSPIALWTVRLLRETSGSTNPLPKHNRSCELTEKKYLKGVILTRYFLTYVVYF